MYTITPIDATAALFVRFPPPMNTEQVPIEVARSLARAQSSLDRQDLQEFCAAVIDLQKLVPDQSGQWQGALNFLARSIKQVPRGPDSATRPGKDGGGP
jgi:hypothetical protein